MKKILKLVVLIIMVMSVVPIGHAATNTVSVTINGENVSFNSTAGNPFVLNGRTLVPFRTTLEKYGATVSYDNVHKIAIAEKNGIVVEVPINKKYIIRDGVQIPNDAEAVVKDGRTYLPIRAVIEAFGSHVRWDSESKTVVIAEYVYEEIKYDTGDLFEGYLVDGVMNGFGTFKWKNGDVYVGNFEDGDFSGYGEYTWKNGDVYEGEWLLDEMTVGVITYSNGEKEAVNHIATASKSEKDIFIEKALEGPSYDEMLKYTSKYLGKEAYTSGEVIDEIYFEDGSMLYLVDTTASYNAFIDMYNQDELEPMEYAPVKIIAVYTTLELDIIEGDMIDFYGYVLDLFSYETVLGSNVTVPCIELIEFERQERVKDILNDLFDNGSTDINDLFK